IRVGPRTKYAIPESRICPTCGEEFTPRRDDAGRGYGRYCSSRCRNRSPERLRMLRVNWDEGGPMTLGLCYDAAGKSKGYFRPETREKYGPRWAKAIAEL